MKVSDYIVEYLISENIEHVFGYPGGMVTHFMDSLSKYSDKISAHINYHEQGAAFAACGYAQATNNIGVAYATSGPGATNLITGICNAYFDSIPTLFITGQVNTFESKNEYPIRQRGFQETDIVSMVKSVTKYAVKVEDKNKIRWYLDYAFYMASEGRKGPVLLDIPMNIFREDVDVNDLEGFCCNFEDKKENVFPRLLSAINQSVRPVFVVGNGVKIAAAEEELNMLINRIKVPVVTTMLAVDCVDENYFGFIGAYGSRVANMIVAKSDLVISFGARLDVRQVGAKRENFAPDSKIIRIDIDAGELQYAIRDEECICADVKAVLEYMNNEEISVDFSAWLNTCNYIQERLLGIDERFPNLIIRKMSDYMNPDTIITTDVGQNQVWIAQSLVKREKQKVYFSGGHGAMGYSLPAAIGCALATGKMVYCFNGDGGIQMNIQELQMIAREQLPIKIILFNNNALGMIRHFQEMYFQDNYFQTTPGGGFTSPDFAKLADAYRIQYKAVTELDEVNDLKEILSNSQPALIEIKIMENTYVFPKLEYGKPNQDQEPLLDRRLYKKLMDLDEDKIMNTQKISGGYTLSRFLYAGVSFNDATFRNEVAA